MEIGNASETGTSSLSNPGKKYTYEMSVLITGFDLISENLVCQYIYGYYSRTNPIGWLLSNHIQTASVAQQNYITW